MSIAWLLYESYQALLQAERQRQAEERRQRQAEQPADAARTAADGPPGGWISGACT
ncbi:hypothetical protein AB0C10_21265 [Microbispora amethystogenes]|uniref:hypothetical protein n=1 Tax=Microbispora amethystogenes TaxID=1427754 RepID=UPI00340F8364